MSDPVTETAHYVAVERQGRRELFLIQQGQIEEQGVAQIIWDRDRRGKDPDADRPSDPDADRPSNPEVAAS